eukprot:UN27731
MTHGKGATNYYAAMSVMNDSIARNGQSSSVVMGVFITDGKPTVDVAKVTPYSDTLKQMNYSFMVVLVQEKEGEKAYNVSTCDGVYPEPCPYFIMMDDWHELHDNVEDIADTLLTEIHPIGEECTSPAWWFFLLLPIPCCCPLYCLFLVIPAKVYFDEKLRYRR